MAEKTPSGLRAAGKRLWSSVADDFDLEEHEATLLLQACQTVDLLVQLEAAILRDGPLVTSPQGVKAHPAAVEARQQRIALARLVAALRLPVGDDAEQAGKIRPRRVGVRGVQRMTAP